MIIYSLHFRFKAMLASGGSPKSFPDQKNETRKKTRKNEKGRKIEDNGQVVEKEKKRRSKPRARRLSSVDSTDSVDLCKPVIDTETAEFLSKLNSPTKKRDSLLGYFPKKESPKELAAKHDISTPKETSLTEDRRPVPAISQSDTPSSGVSISVEVLGEKDHKNEIGTPSGRPRRSCTGKARYDFDLEDSPSKVAKTLKGTPVRKTKPRNHGTPIIKSTIHEDCDDVIVLDDSSNMGTSTSNVTPQGTPKKLAPLFVRSVPKPSPDPEIIKARKAFLQSGVPEKLRLEQEKQKQQDQMYDESVEIFPKISHVRQLNETESLISQQTITSTFKLAVEEDYLRTPSPPTRRGKAKTSNKRLSQLGALSDCVASDFHVSNIIKHFFAFSYIIL